jgi:hypothetical protein
MPRAKRDTYAIDPVGVRRLVVAGDEIPQGWTPVDEDAVEADEKPQAAHKAPSTQRRAAARKPKAR